MHSGNGSDLPHLCIQRLRAQGGFQKCPPPQPTPKPKPPLLLPPPLVPWLMLRVLGPELKVNGYPWYSGTGGDHLRLYSSTDKGTVLVSSPLATGKLWQLAFHMRPTWGKSRCLSWCRHMLATKYRLTRKADVPCKPTASDLSPDSGITLRTTGAVYILETWKIVSCSFLLT